MNFYLTHILVYASNSIDFHTVLHTSDYDPVLLCPSPDLIKTEKVSDIPEVFSKKKNKVTLGKFLDGKQYHVWHKRLDASMVIKYVDVKQGTFKPENKFEEFLQTHGLLDSATKGGVEVTLGTTTSESSKSFGTRDFNHQHSAMYCLEDEHKLASYYSEDFSYVTGGVYLAKQCTRIKSINGQAWPSVKAEARMYAF